MTQSPRQFQKAKPRAKSKPARRVTLSDDEKAKYDELATQRNEQDKTYSRYVPTDSPKR
jgi:hypothetical protein